MGPILNSIVAKVKRNLGPGDHAFSKEEENYRPQPLEKEDDSRMSGGFATGGEVNRSSAFGWKEVEQSKGEENR